MARVVSTAMIGSILMKAGYKTGMFISPYLERFNERMQIDGKPISDEEICYYSEITKKYVDRMLEKGMLHPTFFELLTAMAFYYWADNDVDFVALEVGLGGRLDATNVIDAPEVAMILSISYDHMHVLGNTLEEIAWEKCGIIKPGSDVVCYADQPQEALETIERVCRERGVALTVPFKQDVEIIEKGLFGTTFRYQGVETTVPLMGLHQVYNAIGVIEAAKTLTKRGYPITDAMIVSGIRDTKWVGRLEPICQKPYCVIDAAHNPDAMRVLTKAIDDLFANRRIVTVMGMLSDKDYAYCIPRSRKAQHFFYRHDTRQPPRPCGGRDREDRRAALRRHICGALYRKSR